MPNTIRIIACIFLSLLLLGCGNEGPFGNTPGPKKPDWMTH